MALYDCWLLLWCSLICYCPDWKDCTPPPPPCELFLGFPSEDTIQLAYWTVFNRFLCCWMHLPFHCFASIFSFQNWTRVTLQHSIQFPGSNLFSHSQHTSLWIFNQFGRFAPDCTGQNWNWEMLSCNSGSVLKMITRSETLTKKFSVYFNRWQHTTAGP